MRVNVNSIGVGLLLSLSSLLVPSAQSATTVDITIKGHLILNPPCEITGPGNGPIEVDFSDMVIRKITGNNYQQPVNYTLTCDAADNTNVALTFVGDSVQLNNVNVLRTDNDNLGVRFATMAGGTPTFVALGTPIRFTNAQRPVINAYPLINSSVPANSIRAGAFTANVTLQASYP